MRADPAPHLRPSRPTLSFITVTQNANAAEIAARTDQTVEARHLIECAKPAVVPGVVCDEIDVGRLEEKDNTKESA